jgi:hypothetical protein
MGTTNHYGYTEEGEVFMCLPNVQGEPVSPNKYPYRLHPRKENGRLSVQLKELAEWMGTRYWELDGYKITWTYDTQPASLQMIHRVGNMDYITKWPANVKDVNCPKQEVVWGEPTTNPRRQFVDQFIESGYPNPYVHNPYRVASSFRDEPNIVYQMVRPSDEPLTDSAGQVMAATYGTIRLTDDQLEELQRFGYRRVGPSPTRLRPDGTVHVSVIDRTYRIVE